jgi:hypothetical protein
MRFALFLRYFVYVVVKLLRDVSRSERRSLHFFALTVRYRAVSRHKTARRRRAAHMHQSTVLWLLLHSRRRLAQACFSW